MNLFPMLADRLERDPALVDQALETTRRWLAAGLAPAARLDEWRHPLVAAKDSPTGLRALLALLRDDSEPARPLKDFAPFAGLLSREDRRRVFLQCAYDH